MIVGERKPLAEIWQMVSQHQRLLVVGCGTCVTVCLAGGEKEVGILASSLELIALRQNQNLKVVEKTIIRQCEKEMVRELEAEAREVEAIVSLGCGAGVQTIAEIFAGLPVYPGLNTSFIGIPEEQGVWSERCAACGNCILDRTGGICPIARCSKSLLNGPCGGSQNGKCEIDPTIDCGWQLIYDRLKTLGQLNKLEEILPPKDWSTNRDGGPRRIDRGDLRL
ncbi:MAG: methylenetetrahydrofolate reductase C-terminal domain-containing protein [Clostridia bacterium]|nr:methylenetetrahydrofolate reductase C-terminal domain-containing protein [Clostridia bacterium]